MCGDGDVSVNMTTQIHFDNITNFQRGLISFKQRDDKNGCKIDGMSKDRLPLRPATVETEGLTAVYSTPCSNIHSPWDHLKTGIRPRAAECVQSSYHLRSGPCPSQSTPFLKGITVGVETSYSGMRSWCTWVDHDRQLKNNWSQRVYLLFPLSEEDYDCRQHRSRKCRLGMQRLGR